MLQCAHTWQGRCPAGSLVFRHRYRSYSNESIGGAYWVSVVGDSSREAFRQQTWLRYVQDTTLPRLWENVVLLFV